MKIICNVKRIQSVKDKDLPKALNIYHSEVPTNIRTNENEIQAYISNKYRSKSRHMLFYILYCNDEVIGYAEIGALIETKAFFIDYFILANTYRNNAYFYMCYNLLIEDLKKQYPHFKYIIAEYYVNSNSKSIDCSFGKKCLSLENYKIIDKKYLQPGLNKNEEDSIVECQLLINETSYINNLDKLSSEKYISLLEDIYTNHYIEWYSHFFTSAELQSYKLQVANFLSNARKRCGKDINLKNYTYVNCKYYNPTSCELTINHPFSMQKKITRKKYFFIMLLTFVLANIFSYGLYLLFSKVFKMEDNTISIIFPIVTEIMILLVSNLAWNH